MIEIENQRLRLKSGRGEMTVKHVENLFHWGLQAMKSLGWAWRWAEWWVAFGDNWEPLLEVGQVEENMTKEELRIIDCTPYTRREDAKKCRLAAFGAALRNREYDEVEEGKIALARALRSVLSTKSLVGPLKNSEIDFFTEWLARIYRSNSPQLGYGDDQIPVAETWVNESPVFFKDQSPKYKLGARPLPGMQKLKKGQIFEAGIIEMDSYFTDDNPPRNESSRKPQQKRNTEKYLRRRGGQNIVEVDRREKQEEKRLRSSRITTNEQCPENLSNMTANATTEIRRDKAINLANASRYNIEESLRDLFPVAPKRKRGRPPKKKQKINTSESEKDSGSKACCVGNNFLGHGTKTRRDKGVLEKISRYNYNKKSRSNLFLVAPKRKRGRPPKKNKQKTNTSESEKGSGSKARIANTDDVRGTEIRRNKAMNLANVSQHNIEEYPGSPRPCAIMVTPKRKRGRPSKKKRHLPSIDTVKMDQSKGE
jgi:hypothetical protein